MFLLRPPDQAAVKNFLDARIDEAFSYSEVGMTRINAPAGYNIDHNRQFLGIGPETYDRARTALREWKMFDLPWVELVPCDTTIEAGRTVAIAIRHFGFYSLNAARIVYTFDEAAEVRRFGFAYGTLLEHGEIGEERFSVEFDPKTGKVWYDLYAFSLPGALLAKIGYPFGRYLQKQFAIESKAAMLRAVLPGGLGLAPGRVVLK